MNSTLIINIMNINYKNKYYIYKQMFYAQKYNSVVPTMILQVRGL